jgi:hypothetical protein
MRATEQAIGTVGGALSHEPGRAELVRTDALTRARAEGSTSSKVRSDRVSVVPNRPTSPAVEERPLNARVAEIDRPDQTGGHGVPGADPEPAEVPVVLDERRIELWSVGACIWRQLG